MKILIVLGCAAIYGLVVTSLSYAGITLGGIPTILLGMVLLAAINSLSKKWDEKKLLKQRTAKEPKDATHEEESVERWYTCPECGSLVKEGESCDCGAKRKESEAARRAEEAIINEPPSVWAYRWLNSQRAIGAVTEEQYSKMGDAVASWETPPEPSKRNRHDSRLMILLGSVCAIFVVISIVSGAALSKTYEQNKALNASVSELEAEYEKVSENCKKLEKLDKQNVETIVRKNAKISELENEFKPSVEEWGRGIYSGTICVLLKDEGTEDTFVCHRVNCPDIKNAPLDERMYFPSKLYVTFFTVDHPMKLITCPICNPPG